MIEILEADLSRTDHAGALVALLDAYARDEMGGGEPLPRFARENLPARLAAHPGTLVLLAYVDGAAAGVAVCFAGFSTFACRPLVNIHDIAVAPAYRGRGVSTRLLARIEARAREAGCCKVTLEVLEGNRVARAAYERSGFAPYRLTPALGTAEFWQKRL